MLALRFINTNIVDVLAMWFMIDIVFDDKKITGI